MNAPRLFEFGEPQVQALLERLHRSTNSGDGQDTCRIYFVDVDVLSTYIDGENGDIRSAWSSLFCLTPNNRPERGADVSSETRSLSNAIALSVSGFLMGRFREARTVQSMRLWLTSEHSRELDSVIHAVLQEMPSEVGKWQESLYEQYAALATGDEAGSADAAARLGDIFELLVSNSSAGKIARSYDVRRRFTSTPEQAPLFPSREQGAAFVVRADSSSYLRRTNEVARIALQHLLELIKSTQRDLSLWPALERVLMIVFDAHDPERKMSDYTQRTRADDDLRSLVPNRLPDPNEWIVRSTRIAAHQISDIFSLARIVTLGEFLQRDHPLKSEMNWQVCMLSGASLLALVLKALQLRGLGKNVEIVHPLSVMRFDQFLRPEGTSDENQLAGGEADLAGDEYALGVIGQPGKAAKNLNTGKFIESLTNLLSNASAAYAQQRDRSLQSIHRRLRSDTSKYEKYIRVVGNVISAQFIRTYLQVNRLERQASSKLPMISLPWLTLPLAEQKESAAERFVTRIHDNQPVSKGASSQTIGVAELNQMLRDDPTGYTPLVCAALGYLAMGREWLKSAETVANTAARTALIAIDGERDDGYVPEGNEALYLSAFISRMRVHPGTEHRGKAIDWQNHHRMTMKLAWARCETWESQQGTASTQLLSGLDCSKADLVRLRYKVEETAREAFCMLIDLLAPSNEHRPLWDGNTRDIVDKLSSIHAICPPQTSSSRTHVESNEIAFIRAQLIVALIQCWLCVRIQSERQSSEADSQKADNLDALVADSLTKTTTRDSALLVGLSAIYLKHTRRKQKAWTRSGVAQRPPPRYTEFAAIDVLRVPFLSRLAELPPGEPLSNSILGGTG